MATQLTPQDLQFLSLLPPPGQLAGGINAFNQAAFGNPVAPTSSFGIVPTAPTGGIAPLQARPQPAASPSPQRMPAGGQPAGRQQPNLNNVSPQLLNMIRQKLGLPPVGAPAASPAQGGAGGAGIPGLPPALSHLGGVRGAAQGGPGVGSTAAREALSNFERENVAASPSLKSALDTAMVAMGPAGLVGAIAGNALKSAFGVDGILGSAFNTPGPALSQAAMDAVTKSFYGALNPTASNIQQALAKARATLDVERGLAGMSGHGQVSLSGTGQTPLGGWGTDPQGQLTGNFTSGLGSRLVGGVDFGRGSTGGGGLVGSGGGADTGGGLGGGVGGVGRST